MRCIRHSRMPEAGVEVVTFGQYLRPSKRHLKVQEYVTPCTESGQKWQRTWISHGASGPMVAAATKLVSFT